MTDPGANGRGKLRSLLTLMESDTFAVLIRSLNSTNELRGAGVSTGTDRLGPMAHQRAFAKPWVGPAAETARTFLGLSALRLLLAAFRCELDPLA
jgi:hypothetical protein